MKQLMRVSLSSPEEADWQEFLYGNAKSVLLSMRYFISLFR